jgi:hypothetical protein
MSNDYGFDTHIDCPSCEDVTMRKCADDKRICPRCGYKEPHCEPITTKTTKKKDHTHG